MNYGFNYGFNTESGRIFNNFTITSVANNGTKYGFINGTFGAVDPDKTEDNTLLHEFTWQVDGSFIVSFGTGNTKLTNVDELYIKIGKIVEVAVWNATATAYVFTNLELATQLIADDVKVLDIAMRILPSPFIDISYNTLLRGA